MKSGDTELVSALIDQEQRANKIVSSINIRSFLGLVLNPVIRRVWGSIIDEPERSFFIKSLAGLLFGFCSPAFSL